MYLKTGQRDYQEVLDTYELERMVNEAMPDFPMVRIFVDTIDETDRLKTFIDREGYTALIVHISCKKECGVKLFQQANSILFSDFENCYLV